MNPFLNFVVSSVSRFEIDHNRDLVKFGVAIEKNSVTISDRFARER